MRIHHPIPQYSGAALVVALAIGLHAAPASSQPACVPSTSSCVSGDPMKVAVCDAAGNWITKSCPDWNLCTSGRCMPVCDGLPQNTPGSVICFVPNKDGKNDGLLSLTNDVPRLGVSRNQVMLQSSSGVASVVSSENQLWPYAWLGLSPTAVIGFKLALFERPISKVTVWVKNKRAGHVNQFTRQYFSWKSSPYAAFSTQLLTPPGLSWTTALTFLNSLPPAPTTAQFNYSSGELNFAGWATAGDGAGSLGDAMMVNWLMLAIVQ